MSFFNSFKYKQSAPEHRSEFDLSGFVVGTHDFGVPYRPVLCREVVPGDIWNIRLSTFIRAAAMVLPTFGKVKMVNRFFFVPMGVIHNHWNEFLSGAAISSNGSAIFASVVTVTNRVLINAFRYSPSNQSTSQVWIEKTTSQPYDVSWYYDQETSKSNLKYTIYGRQVLSILKGLGYVINWSDSDQNYMSAMPLLAYAKICYDWLVDSNFVNSIDFQVQSLFKKDGGTLTMDEVSTILKIFSTCYEKDYFTAAWQSPNQVDSNSLSNPGYGLTFDGTPANAGMSVISNDSDATKYSEYHDGNLFTDFGLRNLEALASFVKKRLFTGFRADKQLEAEFGLKLNPELANRSYYIGSVEVPISISDVMATASTDDVTLGEYAGKGIGYNDGFIRFEPNNPEFGYIICMSAIVPETAYYQGRHRELFHLVRNDFFQPEFENVGPQSIRNDELVCDFPSNGAVPSGYTPTGIFGYAPRYSEYKCGVQTSNIIGDYLSCEFNDSGDMDAFHFFRKFGHSSLVTNTYSFKTTADADQFKRIFALSQTKAEHFNVVWNFDIKVERLMSPINDISDEVGNGGVSVMKHSDDLLHG